MISIRANAIYRRLWRESRHLTPSGAIPSSDASITTSSQQGERTAYNHRGLPKPQSLYRNTYSIPRPIKIYQDLLHTRSYSTPAKGEPTIHNVFEPKTGTWQYIIADPSTSAAIIIDPVLDYEPASQTITTISADDILRLIKDKGYKIEWIVETHAHADHLTASAYLQKRLSQIQVHVPPVGIGKRIEQVQRLFGERYGVPKEEYIGVFDKLFDDDETFSFGNLTAKAVHLPGHTPDHLGYHIGDNVFCGDSLFHVDIGSARCDFPGGNATHLFRSARKILALEEHVKIWPGHDYPPEERHSPVPWMSVGDHKRQNKHLRESITEEKFVALRTKRDATLGAPRLLHPSLQMNIRAGQLPQPNNSGHRLFHLPLKLNRLNW
ncbi:hypothetical protein N7495_004323 [Penicillium taxi]|uniref:uncharacterized protein n=1 Tax=Penicillium taxi TaxID=168475 RepID=UPI002545A636|nr:uncharacterized protein N7495_004323 [Penicillium taxi]KAJ5899579.1 hypothetical protein N7495_004323 [Penicillium taxi]